MQKLKGLFAVGSTVVAGSAFAAVPTGVTEAITEAGTDAAVIGGGVLVVLIGIAAFKYMRRAM
jgi:hypothetical protein